MEDKFKNQEILFNACIALNDYILEKEKNNDLDFIDHYMFQATSYVISILHDDLMIKENSFCKCFIYRSLIEVVSIMNMYMVGDITEDAKELINNYNYIVEYSTYRKYKSILEGKQFLFEQIKNNFTDAKSIYRKALDDINSDEFKKLVNSKVPFLGENYSFDALVQKYFNDLYEYYRILSVMIHPNDVNLTIDLPGQLDFEVLEANLFLPIMESMEKYYINAKLPKSKLLREEVAYISGNPLNNAYMNLATSQKQALFDLADMIEKKYNHNTQSELFRELGRSIVSISLDKTFGFTEIVKAKFKVIIEMIALNYYIATLPHFEENAYLAELLTKHTRIKLMEIYGIDTKEKLKDAYECYLNSGDNISFEDFKIKFSSSLGFISEQTSIAKLVYKFIDDITANNEVMKAHRRMLYDESQNLSHANGYMIVANSGAFMEYSTVTTFVDESVDFLIELYYNHYKLYNDTEGEHKENKFVYDIKKYQKRYYKAATAKDKMDYAFKDCKVTYDGKPVNMKEFGVK